MRRLVLLFCIADYLVGRTLTRQSAIQNNSTKCRINTVVPPDDGPGEVRNM